MNSDLYKPYDIRKFHSRTTQQPIPFRICEVLKRKNWQDIILDDIEYIRTSFDKIKIQCGVCGLFKI